MKSIIFIWLFIYFNCVNSQQIFNHSCRDRPVLQNFDLQKYVAHNWYEISRFEAPFQKHCNCGQVTYTLNSDNTVTVKNCCKRLEENDCSIEKALLSEPDHVPLEGKLIFSFGQQPMNSTNYFILSTDYENYSIAYYCENIPENKSFELAWLLSSKPQLDDSVKSSVDNLMAQYFETSLMHVTEQSEEFCAPRVAN